MRRIDRSSKCHHWPLSAQCSGWCFATCGSLLKLCTSPQLQATWLVRKGLKKLRQRFTGWYDTSWLAWVLADYLTGFTLVTFHSSVNCSLSSLNFAFGEKSTSGKLAKKSHKHRKTKIKKVTLHCLMIRITLKLALWIWTFSYFILVAKIKIKQGVITM